mmetsp:Transcript_37622/g.69398  ORF Transcript_37622/g.69398 Transcript_37622/m.69398 type:complete len:103 (-) Transcript_37622:434-742(-)
MYQKGNNEQGNILHLVCEKMREDCKHVRVNLVFMITFPLGMMMVRVGISMRMRVRTCTKTLGAQENNNDPVYYDGHHHNDEQYWSIDILIRFWFKHSFQCLV